MECSVLTKKEQKQTLSSNKKVKKSIKTVLLNFKEDLFTEIDHTETEEVARILGLLRKAKLNKLKIPHEEYKKLSAEEIISRKKAFLDQEERKFFIKNRKFLTPGLNSVARQLPLGKISCVILTNVQPALLNHHIINSCKYFHIPYIIFPNLKKLTKNLLGFKTICLGFKKDIEDSSNIFNPIFKKISEITPLELSETFENDSEGEQESEEFKELNGKLNNQTNNKSEINFDEIFCKRNSKERSFKPNKIIEDIKEETKTEQKSLVSNKINIKNNSKIMKSKSLQYKTTKIKNIIKQNPKLKYHTMNVILK